MQLYEIIMSVLFLFLLLVTTFFSIYDFFALRGMKSAMKFVGAHFDDLHEEIYQSFNETEKEVEEINERIKALEEARQSLIRIQYEFEQELQRILKIVDKPDLKNPSTTQLEHLPPKRKPGRPFRNPPSS